MKLCKLHLRYYPPGIILEYQQSGFFKTKAIDILHLTATSSIDAITSDLIRNECLLTPDVAGQVKQCLRILQGRLQEDGPAGKRFYIYKTLQTHLLPLTNVAFDKQGSKCLTGSYDRTCKVWNVDRGKEEYSLEGHTNVVYSVAYNYPNCDRVLTGSFDKTAKIWDSGTGECLATLWGHRAEIVAAQFSPKGDLAATASMDHTAKLFHCATGQEVSTLKAHSAEIIALSFDCTNSNQLITGSFDGTFALWDVRSKDPVAVMADHEAEISNCCYNWNCNLIATSSLDKTAKIWDARSTKVLATIIAHTEEVLDVTFDWCGKRLATASADCSARVYDVATDFREMAIMIGHREEVSKVCFSPGGACLLTASADSTARIWNSETGNCTQVLSGHEGEVFSCAFTYLGDTLVTASKDNSCKLWR